MLHTTTREARAQPEALIKTHHETTALTRHQGAVHQAGHTLHLQALQEAPADLEDQEVAAVAVEDPAVAVAEEEEAKKYYNPMFFWKERHGIFFPKQ